MRYHGNINFRSWGVMTDTVKKLLIINGAVFILQKIIGIFYPGAIERIFGLSHAGIFYELKIWQVFTYMFLHGSFIHIFFNLFAIWMFGRDLEQLWGKSLFIKYYLFTGIGAGFFIILMNYIIYSIYGVSNVNTIGASGAIFGILLAYGMTWPNREVLIYFIFPVKIKYLIIGYGIFSFLGTISTAIGAGSAISHIGHLGGLISGFLFIFYRKNKYRRTIHKQETRQKEKKVVNFNSKQKKQSSVEEDRIKAKNIIDTLLEKIAKNGMESLTSKERSDLEWARRNYYPDNEDKIH